MNVTCSAYIHISVRQIHTHVYTQHCVFKSIIIYGFILLLLFHAHAHLLHLLVLQKFNLHPTSKAEPEFWMDLNSINFKERFLPSFYSTKVVFRALLLLFIVSRDGFQIAYREIWEQKEVRLWRRQYDRAT